MGIRDQMAARLRALSEYVAPAEMVSETVRPEAGEWRSGIRDDHYVDISTRRATDVSKLGDQMRQADQGDIDSMYEIFEEVERDPKIYRLYFKRRLAVVGKPLLIQPCDDSAQAQAAADLCHGLILDRGGISNWEEMLFDLTDAIGKAFSVQQLSWDLRDGKFVPTHAVRWPQREFRLGSTTDQYAQDQDELRVLCEEQRTDGLPLSSFPAGQWVVHKQKAWSQPLARAALFRAVTWYWLFKRFGMKDWAIFLERLGIPPRVGKYPAHADDKERDALWEAVRDLGKDHACIFPDGSTIELMKTDDVQGIGHHEKMVKHCNDEISVCISGSTMSTDQGNRGARSVKEIYSIEEAEQAEFDSKALARTIRDQICAPIVNFNLGPNHPVPEVSFQLDDHDDLGKRSEVDATLSKLGYPLTVGYVSDKYDLPIPEGVERDELLETGAGAESAALSDVLLGLADAKKKSVRWVTSKS